MAISLLMHGYVLARGSSNTRDNPNSKWNSDAIGRIISLANCINRMPFDVLRRGFIYDSDPSSNRISVLQEIWLETDPQYRSGFFAMMDSIKRRSKEDATIIINDFDVFNIPRNKTDLFDDEYEIDGDQNSAVMRAMFNSILMSRSSILSVESPICKLIQAANPEFITDSQINSLVTQAVGGRSFIERKLNSFKTASEGRPARNQKLGHVTCYRLRDDVRYVARHVNRSEPYG